MKSLIALAVWILASSIACAKGGLGLQGTISNVTITEDAISVEFTGVVSLYLNTDPDAKGQGQLVKWVVSKMPISVRRWASDPPYDKMKPGDDPYAVTFPNAVFRAREVKTDTPLDIVLDGPAEGTATVVALDAFGGLLKIEAKRIFIFPSKDEAERFLQKVQR